jgi:NAD-dependent dihydropyrimidine dehydrogenase PreA subunit
MIQKRVEIDQELCNGCGICAETCHEGAIEMVDGKARLADEQACDGLGNCLPVCPTEAITLIEKEAAAPAPMAHAAPSAGCPGSAARVLDRMHLPKTRIAPQAFAAQPSELGQWPVQIRLVNPRAAYFQNAALLVAADCVAYAYASFHADFIRGRVILIGCPKLDDNASYAAKFTEILSANAIQSICVVRMEVPCCAGIVQSVRQAMLASSTIVPYQEVVVGIDGQIAVA